ncbi:MAG: DUF4468 domain-containing protein [Bacteroidales bacterium]|nr:DUF4468 domain-containing protein [Bacteroidales bacterium]MCF8386312.1 DUF4468 domain-containing protein [Bacteroidales bacterium]MCF8398189.1 DUF4468 domain-containing protein [Bacteroidales bacterium]
MKPIKYLIFFVLITTLSLQAQVNDTIMGMPVDDQTGLITYQNVVEEEGSKKELFYRAIDWVNNFYANPVAVTKIRDVETGRVECRHQFRITYKKEGVDLPAGMVLYTAIVELKDGRYRYTITDYVLKKATRYPVENWLNKDDPAYNEQWHVYLGQIDAFTRDLIANLKEKMQPEPEVEEDEW